MVPIGNAFTDVVGDDEDPSRVDAVGVGQASAIGLEPTLIRLEDLAVHPAVAVVALGDRPQRLLGLHNMPRRLDDLRRRSAFEGRCAVGRGTIRVE